MCPLLDGVDSAILNALCQIAVVYRLGKGQNLFMQGEQARTFYIVHRGGVRLVEHTREGKDVNLKVYGPGEVFGLLAISGPYLHPAEIEAIDDSEIIGFDGQHARAIVMEHPLLGLRVIDTLISHVHDAHRRIRSLAVEKSERRLIRALVHLLNKFGTEQDNMIMIDLDVSQRDLAEFTGMTHETVNRVLRVLEEQGLITRSGKQIGTADMVRLHEAIGDVSQFGIGYLLE